MHSRQCHELGCLEALAVKITTDDQRECGLYQKKMGSGIVKG